LWSDFSLGLGGGVSEVTEKWYNTAGTFLSETDRDTTSGYIQGGYWFSYKGRGFLTLSTRDDDYKVSKGAYKPIEGKTNKIGLSLVYDDTKYGIYTLEGPYIWGSFEKGGKWLDGDFNFKKMSLGGVYYWNTREDHTMIISASAGKGWDLPSHEFFAVGGLGSLRGYDAGAYQGDRYGLARVEYRVPVWKPTFAGYSGTLSVLGFVDGGYAWPEGKGVNLSDLVMGAGGGLRFYFNEFQRGVIALDIAYGFETEDFKVYLGFGATF
jgi:outer membrane translocation and assembly module TamA